MKTLFAVLFTIAFLFGCGAVPVGQYYPAGKTTTTTTTTTPATATAPATQTTTTVVREAPPPPPVVYAPAPVYPVYQVYPVVPMYVGPAWSVCINCRRGHRGLYWHEDPAIQEALDSILP